MQKKWKGLALLAVLVLVGMLPLPAMAAGSAGVSLSASTVTVGKTVKATFSFNGGGSYIAGVKAYVSYDSSLLKYSGASGDGDANVAGGKGTLVLETSSTSKTTLSITLTFTATAVGSAKFSITGSDIVDWDGNTVGGPTASKSLTIKEKEAPAPAPDTKNDPKTDPKDNTSADPQQPETPTDVETALETKVGEDTLYLWRSLQNVTLPEECTTRTVIYNGEELQAAYRESLDLTMVYFTNAEGANGQFYIYEGYEAFYPYQSLSLGGNTYLILKPNADVRFPKGYEQGEQVIGEEKVAAWRSAEDADFCYLYAINTATQKAGVYQFDLQENTLQRVNEAMYELLLASEEPKPDVPAIAEPEVEKTVFERILEDDAVLMVMLGVLGGSLLLVAGMASAMLISRRKRRAQVASASEADAQPAETTNAQAPMTQPEANSEEAPAAEEAPAQAEQSTREESPSPEEASQTAEEDKAE